MVDQPALTPERILRRLDWQVIRRLDLRSEQVGDWSLVRPAGLAASTE